MRAFMKSLMLLHVCGVQAAAQLCTSPCRCSAQPPRCPVGVQPVVDPCGCCKLCPRQLGEPCSKECVCEYGLVCITRLNLKQKGCNVRGILYEDGRDFQVGCALCSCRQGSVLCVPRCPPNVRLPSADCPFPRRVRRPGRCCAIWVCDSAPLALPPARTAKATNASHILLSGVPAHAPCGLGFSTRVSNDNPRCRLERESQVCVVRPCQAPPENILDEKAKLLPSFAFIGLEVAGCLSARAEHLRFCGGCGDGRCCTPYHTVTRSVEFRCPSGKMLKQKLMVIKSCACHSNCPDKEHIHKMIGEVIDKT
uniref:Connective tissue growth factor n=1 Tax=Eptatretus burgeri TaxID=7764 RepID=A0A8C4R0F5_EPTBU